KPAVVTAPPPPPGTQTSTPPSQPVAPPPAAQPLDNPVGNRPPAGGGRVLREERRAGIAALRNDSVIRGLRANVRAARERAVTAGATTTDLAAGDEERRVADLLAGQ